MNTLLLAKILGVYVIVSGLFLMLRGKTVPMLLKDFFEHRAVMWLAGLILIILGGLFAFSPVEYTWMTVLGWLVLIKGVIYILAPEMFMRFTMQMSRGLISFLGFISIVIGALLLGIL